MDDPFEEPTTYITITVPARDGTWVRMPGMPVTNEYVYCEGELAAVLAVYGSMVAEMQRRAKAPPRFRLDVHRADTGILIALQEWPDGEAWVKWQD